MAVLVDTNVLLRRTQPTHHSHAVAVESVARLIAADEPVHFTLQNISEFWNVVTRPVMHNGLGFSVGAALAEVETIERFLTLLPDTPALYEVWKGLVTQYGVIGSKVRDARLVALMLVHRVHRILTFNTSDFRRYRVEVLHPAAVAGQP